MFAKHLRYHARIMRAFLMRGMPASLTFATIQATHLELNKDDSP